MGILDFLGNLISPVTNLIDSLVTTDKEKGEIKIELVKMQNEMASKLLEYESKLMDAQASIIRAEAQGASFLQRNWRPITMLTFLVLVVCDSFGLLTFRLSDEAWGLLKIGLGGYVIGRSAEKVVPQIVKSLKK